MSKHLNAGLNPTTQLRQGARVFDLSVNRGGDLGVASVEVKVGPARGGGLFVAACELLTTEEAETVMARYAIGEGRPATPGVLYPYEGVFPAARR